MRRRHSRRNRQSPGRRPVGYRATVEEPPRLASIQIYPLKAGRAVDLSEAAVEPWGLAGDRRWLVVDHAGRFVNKFRVPTRIVFRDRPVARATAQETTVTGRRS